MCDCEVHEDEPSVTVTDLSLHAWCARGFVVDVIRALREEIAALRSTAAQGKG